MKNKCVKNTANKIIAQLSQETEQYVEQNKKRGRKPNQIALFWAILDNHFVKSGHDVSFTDVMANELNTTKPVIYSWNNKGKIPAKWRHPVAQFFEKHGIKLPEGVTLNDLFINKNGKITNLHEGKFNQFNPALYSHFCEVMQAYDFNFYVLQEHLVRSKVNLLNLPLFMRWVFEHGGISSTRVKAYMSAFIESPELQALKKQYGFITVDEGVEYAKRHGWVAATDSETDDD